MTTEMRRGPGGRLTSHPPTPPPNLQPPRCAATRGCERLHSARQRLDPILAARRSSAPNRPLRATNTDRRPRMKTILIRVGAQAGGGYPVELLDYPELTTIDGDFIPDAEVSAVHWTPERMRETILTEQDRSLAFEEIGR